MKSKTRSAFSTAFCILALSSLACTFSLLQLPFIPSVPAVPTPLPTAAIPTATPLPKAQTIFNVTLLEQLTAGESLGLSVVDEVTGLALNSTTYPMQSVDGYTYTATLALPYNAIVKYHYVRLGNGQAAEETALGESIRYRIYYVAGQAEVKDILGGWADKLSSRPMGSIQGRRSEE